jgi:Tfp pilus assembly protein PilW
MLEFLTATGILVLLLAGVYFVLMWSRSTYSTGEAKADIQQNARLAIEMIEADLRMVGYGYPTDPALVNPLVKVNAATGTSIDFWADINNASTILAADVNVGNTTFSVTNASGISVGNGIWLINGGTFDSFTVTGVNTGANPNTITVSAAAARTYPRGIQVGRPMRIVYSYGAANGGTISKDSGDGGGAQALIDNVSAFSLQYFDMNDNTIAVPVAAGSLRNIRRITVDFTVRSARSAGPSGFQSFRISSDVRPRNL